MVKPKLLLHVCCGPCSTAVIEQLADDYDIIGFFYGPNIHPENEYTKRHEAAIRYTKEVGIEIISGDYDTKDWFSRTKGFEQEPEGGNRCDVCFAMRLAATAKEAAGREIPCFASTLSVSPHKNVEKINKIGTDQATEYGVRFVGGDWKKQDGFKRSMELAKKHDLYRQNYCGCIYSKQEAERARK